MMICGIALTAGTAGHFLDPYSPLRLMQVVGVVTLGAVALFSASALVLPALSVRVEAAARKSRGFFVGARPAIESGA